MSDTAMCPKCGAPEVHPVWPDKLVVRGYKVSTPEGDYSQCLRCSGGWDKDLLRFDEGKHDPLAGWFLS